MDNNYSSLDYIGISSHRTVTLYCAECGHPVLVKLKCSDRTCPECRKRIYFKLFKGWSRLVNNMRNPKLLTLTIVNKPNLIRDDIKSIRSNLNKLLRRKYYADRIRGGLYVIEITNTGKGWHVHIHALIDTFSAKEGFLYQSRISKDWHDITKDSMIVHISKAYSPQKGLRYILKYFIKPPKINGESELYNTVLKKTRLIQTFGFLYGSKAEKHAMHCEKCNCTSWIIEFEIEKQLNSLRKDVKGNKTVVLK